MCTYEPIGPIISSCTLLHLSVVTLQHSSILSFTREGINGLFSQLIIFFFCLCSCFLCCKKKEYTEQPCKIQFHIPHKKKKDTTKHWTITLNSLLFCLTIQFSSSFPFQRSQLHLLYGASSSTPLHFNPTFPLFSGFTYPPPCVEAVHI